MTASRATVGIGRRFAAMSLLVLVGSGVPAAIAHHSPYPFTRAEIVKAKSLTGAASCVGRDPVGSKFRHIRCLFPKLGEAVTFHRLASGKVTTTRTKIPRTRAALPYSWTGSGHWITSIGDAGRTIRLEDRSLWLVASYDRFTARFWLIVDDITVLHDFGDRYRLVNTSEDESVDATYLGRS